MSDRPYPMDDPPADYPPAPDPNWEEEDEDDEAPPRAAYDRIARLPDRLRRRPGHFILPALGLVAALAFSAPSHAQAPLRSMTLAADLGGVLASENVCGLHFDQDAIAAFIDKRVRAD